MRPERRITPGVLPPAAVRAIVRLEHHQGCAPYSARAEELALRLRHDAYDRVSLGRRRNEWDPWLGGGRPKHPYEIPQNLAEA